jgi:uncharacterized RDD family membrane protein YckC
MEENQMTVQETGLADELNYFIQYTPATTGQRFLNFLIDNLLMRFALSYFTATIVGFFLGSLFPEFTSSLINGGNQLGLLLLAYIIAIFNYLVYYTFCEKVFNGYTLGKLITGTKALREDGTPLTFKDSFMRSLVRLVPFEPFSGFGGYPWHDGWTKTKVIKSR